MRSLVGARRRQGGRAAGSRGAEGVDGADTAARLVRLGCTRGQGNALGEAMPGDQVDRLLQG